MLHDRGIRENEVQNGIREFEKCQAMIGIKTNPIIAIPIDMK
jgi:hypothetical protein